MAEKVKRETGVQSNSPCCLFGSNCKPGTAPATVNERTRTYVTVQAGPTSAWEGVGVRNFSVS